jgi:hypothetical protein
MINSQSENLYPQGKRLSGLKSDNNEKGPNEMRSTNNTKQTNYTKLARNAKSAHNTKLIHNVKLIYNAKLAHNSKPTNNATLFYNATLIYNAKLTNKIKLAYNAKLTYNAKSTNGATLFNSANAGSDEIPIKEIRQVYDTQYVHTYGNLHIQDTSKTCPSLPYQSRPSQSCQYLSCRMRPVIFAILRGTSNSNKHIWASSTFTRAGPLTRASILTKINLAIPPNK